MWFVQRHTFSGEKPCIASTEKEKRADAMQRYTISGEKSCVVTRGRTRRRETVQRYTISGREPCIASTERGRSTYAAQRHTFLIRKACVADRDQGRRMWFVQRHTISGEKNCVASMEREKTNRGHTAQRPTASYDQHTTALHNKSPSPQKTEEELYWSVCEPTKLAECVPSRVPKRGQRRRGWRRLTP